MHFSMTTGIDVPAVESESEAEELTSFKASGTVELSGLTPLHEKDKVPGKTSCSDGIPEHNASVTVINKVVSTEYKEVSSQSAQKTLRRVPAQAWALLMAFKLTLFAVCRSVAFRTSRKLPGVVSDVASSISCLALDPEFKEEFQPLSQADDIPTVLGRVNDLEEKVSILYTKPVQMPVDKEELLNAAVYRIDALEAELKALHESLIKQEELLAYIDAQQAAKFRKKKFCW